MKRIVGSVGFATVIFLASGAAAATIDYNVVAVEDQLIGGFNVGNSEQAEQDFLFDYLELQGYNTDELSYEKIDIGGADSFVEVTGEPAGNLWAIDFSSYGITDPLAFVVKYGNAEYDHYLYWNLDSSQYGVVDLGDITAVHGNITITSISHTGTVSPVPEPGSLSLMLFGLGSVVVATRKRLAS